MIGAEDYVTSHQETILPKMFELLPQAPFVERVEKIQGRTVHKLTFFNGSTIKLMSYESSEGKWEGPTYHIAAFDEPPPRNLYVATKRGLMRYEGPCLFSMTPLKEPWIHDELYVSEEAVHVQDQESMANLTRKSFFVTTVSLDDNPYLTAEAKDSFLMNLDEEEREARQFGRFRHLMGRVYKKMDPDVHVLDDEKFSKLFGEEWKTWPAALVVDPHDRKPFAMAWCVVSPRNEMIWIHEWPEFDFFGTKAWHWDIPDYVEAIEKTEKALGLTNVFWRIMDPNFGRSPKAGMGGKTLQQEFDEHGLWFDCEVDNDLSSGHVLVRAWLGNPSTNTPPRMFWRSNCTNFVRGMLGYTWDDYKAGIQQGRSVKEAVKDKFKDFPDLARYAVKGGVEYMDPAAYTPVFRPIRHGGLG
jgi:phage terminase large subunit-like protein